MFHYLNIKYSIIITWLFVAAFFLCLESNQHQHLRSQRFVSSAYII